MTHTAKPCHNHQDVSHITDVGGSGVPLATGDFRTYLVSRLIAGVVLLLGLSLAIFILTQVVPGDPLEAILGEGSGLARSSTSQYPDWVGRMSRGDFGHSYVSGTSVRDEIFEHLPSTLSLLPLTMFFAAAVSIPLGFLAAARRGTLIDRMAGGAAVFGVGASGFWLALMLILVLPMWSGDGPMNDLVLPALVLAIPAGAVMVRIIRCSILEVLDREGIVPSRGGGLPPGACSVRALGNLLIWAPALFGGFLGGAIVVETVFGAPGIGPLTLRAVLAGDYAVLQGVAMAVAVMAVMVLGFSLVAGLLVRRLEPRAVGGQAADAKSTSPTTLPSSSAWKMPMVPWIVIGVLIVAAVSAPIVATHDPLRSSLDDALSAPGAGHLLGTDSVGRDILSRLIYGTRSSLAVALLSLIPVALVGGGLGLLSGYAGGKVDAIVTGALDNIPAFPVLIFAILVTGAFGPGLMSLVIAVTLVLWPRFARAARDEMVALKAGGAFSLPNAVNPIMALLTLHFGLAILMEATLSFLGLGIQPPTPSWGAMMADSMQNIRTAPWLAVFPGLALTAVTVAMIASPFRWSKI